MESILVFVYQKTFDSNERVCNQLLTVIPLEVINLDTVNTQIANLIQERGLKSDQIYYRFNVIDQEFQYVAK